MMTPDIRPRPSPGSRIYSKEETPPPNQGITRRVGRWTLNQGWVLNSPANIIVSRMRELLLGLRTFLREELSPLEKQPSNAAITLLLLPSVITRGGLFTQTLSYPSNGWNISVIHSRPPVDSECTHSSAIAWALLKASASHEQRS